MSDINLIRTKSSLDKKVAQTQKLHRLKLCLMKIVLCIILQNCQLEQEATAGAAPNATPSTNNPTNTTNPVDITPKIPNGPKTEPEIETDKNPPQTQNAHAHEPKGILGAVTTWFPASSTIQVGQVGDDTMSRPEPPPRPQLVEFVGSKKYLIVPRHNVLSVAHMQPAMATTPIPQNNPVKSEPLSPKGGEAMEIDAPSIEPAVVPLPSVVPGESVGGAAVENGEGERPKEDEAKTTCAEQEGHPE